MALRLEPLIAAKAKGNQGTRTDIPQISAECPAPIETRQEVAKAANVSHDTVAKLKDMLIRFRPKGKRGPKAKGSLFDNVKEIDPPKPGNSRLYIEERLQRDHPEIWQERSGERVRAGWRGPSVRAY